MAETRLRIVSTLAALANASGYYTPEELAAAAGASLAGTTNLWCGTKGFSLSDLLALCEHLQEPPAKFLVVRIDGLSERLS
jgi:DNA-binding Xre family transcriptional regulator